MKKMFALALTLLLCLVTGLALAEEHTVDGVTYTYIVENNEVTITKAKYASGAITIPEMIAGYPVTAIGENAFRQDYDLNSVDLSNVTSIGDSAFGFCTSLEHAEFKEITSVGAFAFESCAKLTNVDLSKATSIGENAFRYCGNLTAVDLNNATSVGNHAFQDCTNLTSAVFDKLTVLSPGMFQGCTKLTGVDLSNVTSIGSSAFKNCTSLTNADVDLGNVTSLGGEAFYKCTGLTSIALPKATSIGNYAFEDCTGLTNVTLGDDETSIGISSFEGCTSLKTINLEHVISVGNYAFRNCENLEDVDLRNVTTVGNEAFINCAKLTSVDLSKATSIGYSAFKKCKSLTDVVLGPGVTTVSEKMFDECTSLQSVKFENVTVIGEQAFYNCDALTDVNLSNVTSIGRSAFFSCENLMNVDLSKLTEISERAFYSCKALTEVDLSNVTGIGTGAFSACTDLTAVKLNNDINSISSSAFSGCSNLTDIDLSNVTSIMSSAFSGCSNLTDVDLSNVTSIGEYAFRGCTGLANVNLSNVTSIGENAFRECTGLVDVTFGAASIDDEAFIRCTALPKVDLSKVTSLGDSSFDDCTELAKAYIPRESGFEKKLPYGVEIHYGNGSDCGKAEANDETHHWETCACGGNLVKNKESHSGGTATCTKLAVCKQCKAEYGNIIPHAWSYTASGATITETCDIGCGKGGSVTLKAPGSCVYDGTEKVVQCNVDSPLEGAQLSQIVYNGDRVNAGTFTASITIDGAVATLEVTITQSQTSMTAGADKSDYTYGEAVTITVVPVATGVSPFSLKARFAAPTAGQVSLWNGETQIAEPKDAATGKTVTFTLDTVADGFTPGSYTLTAKYEESGNMAAQTAEVTFVVNYLPAEDAPDAEIPGGEDGEPSADGWLDEDPTLTAPENTQISLDPTVWPEDGETGNSVTLPTEDGEHEITYYIKDENGTIAEKTVTIRIDKNAPEVDEPTVLADPTKAEITAPATDAGSGVADYTLTQTSGKTKVEITDNGAGVFTITGMTPGETYNFTLTVRDYAGHETKVDITITAPLMPDLPQTGDNSRFVLWLMLLGMAGAAMLLMRRRAHN